MRANWATELRSRIEDIRARQLDALRLLRDKLAEAKNPLARHLTTLLEDPAPSTDVGVLRLLGKSGVFSRLDAINGPLPGKFSDDWDGIRVPRPSFCGHAPRAGDPDT